MIESRRMELDELHILHCALGTIDHRNAIARSHQRIGCLTIDGFTPARSHDSDLGKESIHFARLFVQHVCSVATDSLCVAGYDDTHVVLGDDFHGKMVGKHGDVGMCLHRFDERCLYLRTRIVLVVQDAEFAVSALLVQIKGSVGLLVKVHSPFDEFLNLGRGATHNLFHRRTVVDVVTGNEGILNVFLEIIYRQVGHRGDASLCKIGISLFQSGFTNKGYSSLVGYFQGEAHACQS